MKEASILTSRIARGKHEKNRAALQRRTVSERKSHQTIVLGMTLSSVIGRSRTRTPVA